MTNPNPSSAEAIKFLVEEVGAHAAPKWMEGDDGLRYIARGARYEVELPPKEPTASTVKVSTLLSFVDFLAVNVDGLDLAAHLVHVQGPHDVRFFSELQGRHRDREIPLAAEARCPSIAFGQWQPIDELIISLQARFLAPDDDEAATTNGRDALIKVLSKVKTGQDQEVSDDGMAQRVAVKAGIETLATVAVPNPVMLRPFRTFAEVDQPHCPFVVRLRPIARGIEAALFEADGGAWQLVAVRRIKEWLENALHATGGPAGDLKVIA